MWITRDKFNTYEEDALILWIDVEKPSRIQNEAYQYWFGERGMEIPKSNYNPLYEQYEYLTWEDEPVEVSIVPTMMNSVQTKLAESVDEYFDYVSHQQDIPSYNKKEEDALYDIMVWRWQDWTDVKYDKPDTRDLNFKDYDI